VVRDHSVSLILNPCQQRFFRQIPAENHTSKRAAIKEIGLHVKILREIFRMEQEPITEHIGKAKNLLRYSAWRDLASRSSRIVDENDMHLRSDILPLTNHILKSEYNRYRVAGFSPPKH